MPAALSSPLQLAIDTSSRATSICIARGNDPLATLGVRVSDRRSERLWSEVDFLLLEIGLSIEDIDLFSVCTGPGGFTGIRVGMAAAKGLATARRRPLIGITSLEAVAAAAGKAAAVLVMTRAHQPRAGYFRSPEAQSDEAGSQPGRSQAGRSNEARGQESLADRGEVFSQLFRNEAGGAPEPLDAPMASSAGEALERGANIGKLLILGDAASDNIDVIERIASGTTGGRRREWAIGQSPDLLAHLVARVALARYSRGESADPGEVKACYVRPAQAVTKLALGLVGPGLRP